MPISVNWFKMTEADVGKQIKCTYNAPGHLESWTHAVVSVMNVTVDLATWDDAAKAVVFNQDPTDRDIEPCHDENSKKPELTALLTFVTLDSDGMVETIAAGPGGKAVWNNGAPLNEYDWEWLDELVGLQKLQEEKG